MNPFQEKQNWPTLNNIRRVVLSKSLHGSLQMNLTTQPQNVVVISAFTKSEAKGRLICTWDGRRPLQRDHALPYSPPPFRSISQGPLSRQFAALSFHPLSGWKGESSGTGRKGYDLVTLRVCLVHLSDRLLHSREISLSQTSLC